MAEEDFMIVSNSKSIFGVFALLGAFIFASAFFACDGGAQSEEAKELKTCRPAPIPYEEGKEIPQRRPLNNAELQAFPLLTPPPPEKAPSKLMELYSGTFAVPSSENGNPDLLAWDGAGVRGGRGWANGNAASKGAKAGISEKEGAGKDGSAALAFNFSGPDWKGGGWNWAGWYDPGKTRTLDISKYKSLAFELKVIGDVKPHESLMFGIISSPKNNSNHIDPVRIGLNDAYPKGEFIKILIPISELAKDKDIDLKNVWEFAVGYWGEQEIELLVDKIWFTDELPPDTRYVAVKEGAPTPIAVVLDAGEKTHDISPLIYGVANLEDKLLSECGISSRRLGGNQASPYNWKTAASNQGADWFFRNVSDMSDKAGWVAKERAAGREPLVTIPMLNWLAKNSDNSLGGFPVDIYGPQKTVCPNDPKLGNGVSADAAPGELLAGKDQSRFAVQNSPGLQGEFVGTIASLGSSSVWYIMDNEPMLWFHTHAAIEPKPLTYEDYWKRYQDYAQAVLKADPQAKLAGPASAGWNTMAFCSADQMVLDEARGRILERKVQLDGQEAPWWKKPPFRLQHGNIPFIEWFAQQTADYETKTGQRILHALDVHYYPQRWVSGIGVYSPGNNDRNPLLIEARIQSTRDLWDAQYTSQSRPGETWIKETQAIIPRLQYVAKNYANGAKLALNEYDWTGEGNISGALAQAELLGIFARHNLDIANKWGGLPGTQKLAFLLFRNYDGKGGAFGEEYLQCGSSRNDTVSVFASRRKSDKSITAVMINKSLSSPADISLQSSGVARSEDCEAFIVSQYRIDSIDKKQIKWTEDASLRLPPLSAALFVWKK